MYSWVIHSVENDSDIDPSYSDRTGNVDSLEKAADAVAQYLCSKIDNDLGLKLVSNKSDGDYASSILFWMHYRFNFHINFWIFDSECGILTEKDTCSIVNTRLKPLLDAKVQ